MNSELEQIQSTLELINQKLDWLHDQKLGERDGWMDGLEPNRIDPESGRLTMGRVVRRPPVAWPKEQPCSST